MIPEYVVSCSPPHHRDLQVEFLFCRSGVHDGQPKQRVVYDTHFRNEVLRTQLSVHIKYANLPNADVRLTIFSTIDTSERDATKKARGRLRLMANIRMAENASTVQ